MCGCAAPARIIVKVNNENAAQRATIGQSRLQELHLYHPPLYGVVRVMSDTLALATKPVRIGTSDVRMIAQVEKWMSAIREINRDEKADPIFRVRLRPAVSVTE
jgi:hypothetical protein